MFQREKSARCSERDGVTGLAIAPGSTAASLTGIPAPSRPTADETGRPRPHRSASFARVVGADCTDRSWPLDADGVEQVAARLARLGDRWGVVHGVPVQPAGIADLLLVGPGGVYAVTVLHTPGATVWAGGETLLVNGASTRWVSESRELARSAATRLTAVAGIRLEINALLVVVGAHDGFVSHGQPRDGARVLTRRNVDGWLRDQPTRLDATEVESLYAAARAPHTWAA